MSERRPFTYCVLRYIHDPVAAEAMNIGVVVYSAAAKFLDVKFEYRYERLSNAFSDFDGEGYRRTVRAFDSALDELRDYFFAAMIRPEKVPANVADIVRRIWPDRGLSFSAGMAMSGLSRDLVATTADLFQRLVASQNERSTDERRTDEEVWASYRKKLSGTILSTALQPKTFETQDISVRFDYAFKNERWHVLRPLSLDYARQGSITRKASEFLGECVALSENPDVENGRLYLLLGAPTQPEHIEAYTRAKRMLDRMIPFGHELVEERDAEKLVARLDDVARQAAAH